MKILIGADVVPKEDRTEQLFIDGDIRALFGDICDAVKSADRTIINL